MLLVYRKASANMPILALIKFVKNRLYLDTIWRKN